MLRQVLDQLRILGIEGFLALAEGHPGRVHDREIGAHVVDQPHETAVENGNVGISHGELRRAFPG
ncbi:MAG: hypothetical protein BWY56_01149 [Acidobacteria bacterium ADurb.Bin340]|nr:MAG: hypothetical protein BWY56_01149 [Acidobacteria bacterium ADurb.Bin340]